MAMAGFMADLSVDCPRLQTVEAMLPLLETRAPRDVCAFAEGALTLGAIVAPAEAPPLVDHGGRFVLCYDGKLYNHPELRAELGRSGASTALGSEAEVVLAAWTLWGPRCLSLLRGPFALALWDRCRHELVVARDSKGRRPLFYATQGRTILFASSPRAFSAFPGFRLALDASALSRIFASASCVPGESCFTGVQQVAAGALVRFDARVQKQQFVTTAPHEKSYRTVYGRENF